MASEDLQPGEADFNSFFDQLSNLAAEKKPIPADLLQAEPATEPVTEPVAELDTPTTTPTAATESDEPEVATEPVTEPVVAAQPAHDELLERFVKAMEAQKAAAPAPAPAPVAHEPPPLYTPEELQLLQTFEKDWPDFAKVLPVLFRANRQETQAALLSQVGQTLAPVVDNMQSVQFNYQLNGLRQSIPDYDKVRDPVINWALNDPGIPPYLRNAYKGVIEKGEVSEIADLVGRWRQATGTAAPQQGAKPAPVAKEKELSEAAKQAVQSLAPVVSKRSVAVSTEVPSGFEDAFKYFSAAKT